MQEDDAEDGEDGGGGEVSDWKGGGCAASAGACTRRADAT